MTTEIDPPEVRLVELLLRDPTLTVAEARKELCLSAGRDARPPGDIPDARRGTGIHDPGIN